ncbi:MAG: hypothetical protein ABMB14_00370 [Myxococcota bacterium]
MSRATITVCLVFGWAGCPATLVEGGDDDDATTDGTTPAGDDDDDGTTPGTEAVCDDGVDDDADGAADCDDTDCDADEQCALPTELAFETLISFDANALAELGGYGDCDVHITAALVQDPADSCDGCDRVFRGPFEFIADDCPDDIERPSDGGYGIDFRSDTEWEVFGKVEGVWTSLGVATDDGTGVFRINDTTPVEVSGVEVGDLTTFFAFTP